MKGVCLMEQKLETFLTLCRTMHYGRAAEILNLSQPAVSKHIQALEVQYGVSLFTYSKRKLHKTPQAKILEQYVASLQYNEENLYARLHESPRSLLRIGATKSIGDFILFPEIRRFLSQPENKLEFIVDNTAHLLEQLRSCQLDFVVLEGIFDKEYYDYFLLRKEPYIGICAPHHPFAGRDVSFDELLQQRLILREQGSGTRNILERELAKQGFTTQSFKDTVCISSFTLIKELVKEDCGISFLYEAVVKDEPEFGHFTCSSLTGVHNLNVVFLKDTNAKEYAHHFFK